MKIISIARLQKSFLSSGILKNATSQCSSYDFTTYLEEYVTVNALRFVVMAPYSTNSLLKVETQHLRLMYPRRSCLVSLWLMEHAYAATSEYDRYPTSRRQNSRGSLANRQSEVAASFPLRSWPLPSFLILFLCAAPASCAALLS